MLAMFITFMSIVTVIGISLTGVFAIIFILFVLGYSLVTELHSELSGYRFLTKTEIKQNLPALLTVTILFGTGLLGYFYFEYSLLFSIIFAFLVTCLFVLCIRFDEFKKEYRKFKYS